MAQPILPADAGNNADLPSFIQCQCHILTIIIQPGIEDKKTMTNQSSTTEGSKTLCGSMHSVNGPDNASRVLTLEVFLLKQIIRILAGLL